MRQPWISGAEALRERLINPAQVRFTDPEAAMPPYMESLLAHIRLLIGVPFDYLIPDARLLPEESIRFFYLDRSWTDRLVDGALAVGKIGTREQAHHQAHAPAISRRLDLTERVVRPLQLGRASFLDLRSQTDTSPADVVSGFLLRSAAVSGWPHMDVRAYNSRLTDDLIPSSTQAIAKQLPILRLERLSPSVLMVLFQGTPELVVLEEPHHGVQFGVSRFGNRFAVNLRDGEGKLIKDSRDPNKNIPLPLPVRAANNRVVAVAELRKKLEQQRASHPEMPAQTGAASLAISVLNPPWRQRFEGTKDNAVLGDKGSGVFVSVLMIGSRVTQPSTKAEIQKLMNP